MNWEKKMAIKISKFDISEYLNNEEAIAAYLSAIVEERDPKLLLSAISDIAKARGMAKIASDSGLGRESLYKALNPEAKPRFDTIMRVLNSLGVNIGFNAIAKKKRKVLQSKSVSPVKKVDKRVEPLSSSDSGELKKTRQKKRYKTLAIQNSTAT
jgi:probable addiction module antidote protein